MLYTYTSPFWFHDLDSFYDLGCYSDMSLPFFSIGSEKATSNHLVRQTKALHQDQIESKIGHVVKVCIGIANQQDSPFTFTQVIRCSRTANALKSLPSLLAA